MKSQFFGREQPKKMSEEEGKWVLVTGGLGYIGSHVTIELCLRGFNVILVDKIGHPGDIHRGDKLKEILKNHGCQSGLHITYKDLEKEQLWIPHACDYIIHLAAYKSVPESVANPFLYYHNNINALLTTLACAKQWRNKPVFIFSSSATVYGEPTALPLTEDSPLGPTNSYGQTKLMCEQILRDVVQAPQAPISKAIVLRYFNPVGAHPSGLIGETTTSQKATNLMPVVLQALKGEREVVNVFGTDYGTRDGTALRDYLHVMDLAEAHVAACLAASDLDQLEVINLGRGQGVSVAEVVAEMEMVTGMKVPVKHAARREGDVEACFTSCERAARKLGWTAKRTLRDMCLSAAQAAGIKTVDSD